MPEIVEIVLKATDNTSDAFKKLTDNLKESNREGLTLTGTFKALSIGAIAMGAALGGAAVAGLKLSLDATMKWADNLEMLNKLLGLSGPQAAAFAGSMEFVGLTVEEGTSGLAIFARNAQNAKDAMGQASSAFRESMRDLVDANKDAIENIKDTWATQQADAAQKIAQIWQDARDKAIQAQEDINRSTKRSQEDAELSKARSLEDLQISTRQKLGRTTNFIERNRIMSESKMERERIERDFKRKMDDIAKEKARKEADAKENEERERKSAEKQTAIIREQLAKQEVEYEKHLRKQEESFEKSAKKLQQVMVKTIASSPFEKALAQLHLTLGQVMDKTGKINFKPILDAFAKLPEGTEKARIAMELFGRGGVKFLEWIDEGSAGIDRMQRIMKEFGGDLSDKQIKSVMTFTHALNEMRLKVELLFQKLGINLMPAFQGIVDIINNKVLPAFNKWLDEVIPKIKDFVGLVVKALETGDWSKVADAVKQIAVQFWTWFTGKGGVLDSLGTQLQKFADAIGSWASGPSGTKAINDSVKVIGTVLANALTAFVQTSLELLQFLGELVGRVIGWFNSPTGKAYMGSMAQAFVDGFVPALSSAVSKVDWGSKILGAMGGIEKITDFITGQAAQQSLIGSIQNVLGFQSGGIVPGPIGQPQLAVVHGGETVLPVGRGSGITVYFTYAPAVSLASQQEAQNVLQPFIEKGIITARSRQIGATR